MIEDKCSGHPEPGAIPEYGVTVPIPDARTLHAVTRMPELSEATFMTLFSGNTTVIQQTSKFRLNLKFLARQTGA
ncbi:hypothetical protein L1987_32847 [Smallanthus sonchifolius]|uniref:Uncharacterized protein n=1 Tax=Smallanthus sonchifolius TaxID=185202 RepID=A0ACB9HNQ1_9ASTR|nr:hypothetical protein L1987_32847 [Smallanthus sonchifolius]